MLISREMSDFETGVYIETTNEGRKEQSYGPFKEPQEAEDHLLKNEWEKDVKEQQDWKLHTYKKELQGRNFVATLYILMQPNLLP